MTKKIANALSDSVPWMGIRRRSEGSPPMKLLDYACGNGMVSNALLGQFEIIRGIDISDSSVESYNEIARQAGVPAEQMLAVQGSIPSMSTNPVLDTEEFFNFDLAVMSMALHHIDDRVNVLAGLCERLRSGGVLVVVDLAPETHTGNRVQDHGNEHPPHHAQVQHTISKHGGFGSEEMKALLTEAGFAPESFDYQLYPGTTSNATDTAEQDTCQKVDLKPFFIAKSVKG